MHMRDGLCQRAVYACVRIHYIRAALVHGRWACGEDELRTWVQIRVTTLLLCCSRVTHIINPVDFGPTLHQVFDLAYVAARRRLV